jgi:cysteine desulfurase family protein (TIGR01976 family)
MFSEWNVHALRTKFPALTRQINGRSAIYLDGPAGSQVPRSVADAVSRYLLESNANHGGLFTTSRESDALLERAHQAIADFLGTQEADLIAFGANMTTITLALSRAVARTWRAGDEIIVTNLDHDANVTPWVLAARDAGATVRHAGIRAEDCTLDLDDFEAKLSSRTRLVAVGCASNAVGTINPIERIVNRSHAAGAQVFLDAVHFAPHALMDVVAWDCDFLACSAYKFFGPHVGILYGKRKLLTELPAYRIRPAPNNLPGRWMTGTPSHEGIAGALAAIDYLTELGRSLGATGDRRQLLARAFAAIQEYERQLSAHLIAGLGRLPQFKIWGITDPRRFHERVPTIAVTHHRLPARAVAEMLDRHGIFVWHGNFYALSLSEALGLEPEGMVRIGLLHYNMVEEIDRLLGVLAELR